MWSEVLNPICAVVRGGFASFLEKLRSGRENPPLAQTTKRSKRVEDPPTGGNDGEVPPVPILNTEVKLSSAESTWLDTAREDRSLPVPPKASRSRGAFFVCSPQRNTKISRIHRVAARPSRGGTSHRGRQNTKISPGHCVPPRPLRGGTPRRRQRRAAAPKRGEAPGETGRRPLRIYKWRQGNASSNRWYW